MADSSLFSLLYADVFLIHCFIICNVHFNYFYADHNYLSLGIIIIAEQNLPQCVGPPMRVQLVSRTTGSIFECAWDVFQQKLSFH